MLKRIVYGDSFMDAVLPDHTREMGAGVTVPLAPVPDIAAEVASSIARPLDGAPLTSRVKTGSKVTIAFDDPTVPCYAPVWPLALPVVIGTLEGAGVRREDISLICANALHRKFSQEELGRLLGDELMRDHADRLTCHDAEDPEGIVALEDTESGYHVELNKAVVGSDLTIYLNCSTTRGFSGGWKSVCVGLSTYRSIHHHHSPDIMSMSLDRNRMHAMLDEMGAVVEKTLGPERIFKLETVLANPFQVHRIFGGSTGAARNAILDTLRSVMPPRRDASEEKTDVVIYGVPDWSPYAAFSHGNPILDLISTGLGYLGGMIEAAGKPGCTVILVNPAKWRWDSGRHASYPEVWERVLPETKDPDEARHRFEPDLSRNESYIERYRNDRAFHPVHAIMAIYPLKRLRHAGRVIVAGAEDPSVPAHIGFDSAATVEEALGMAADIHGPDPSITFVEYPQAANRT